MCVCVCVHRLTVVENRQKEAQNAVSSAMSACAVVPALETALNTKLPNLEDIIRNLEVNHKTLVSRVSALRMHSSSTHDTYGTHMTHERRRARHTHRRQLSAHASACGWSVPQQHTKTCHWWFFERVLYSTHV